jgi:hypothetical protein
VQAYQSWDTSRRRFCIFIASPLLSIASMLVQSLLNLLICTNCSCVICPALTPKVAITKSEAHDKELYQQFKQDIDDEVANMRVSVLFYKSFITSSTVFAQPMALPAKHSTPSMTVPSVLFLSPKPSGLSCSSLSEKSYINNLSKILMMRLLI